jgi:uncharacterized repeat protein (TIGR02543 family)
MIARVPPSFSQAQIFPSLLQASNCFVTFDFSTEEIAPYIMEVIPDGKVSRLPAPSRNGFTFGGWFLDTEHTVEWDFNTTVSSENIILYAKWTADIFYIIYFLNNGINDPRNPASYTVEYPDIVLEKATRGDDNFIAWYDNALFFGEPVEIIRTSNARDISLHARFLVKRKTVVVAQEPKTNPYEGDPKLYLTDNGAELRYRGGQPVMERGLENQALISLFTREGGWCGNAFLPPENRVGSDYEATCAGSITRSKLADIEDAAVRAMQSNAFQQVDAQAHNPKADHLRVEITAKGGDVLSLSRESGLWQNQRAKS